jgi:plasmid stabilization system protein ParE
VTRHFVLTPQARSDLKEILPDIAEDSPETAERLRSEFRAGLERLGRSPGIGHYHDELPGRRFVRSQSFTAPETSRLSSRFGLAAPDRRAKPTPVSP